MTMEIKEVIGDVIPKKKNSPRSPLYTASGALAVRSNRIRETIAGHMIVAKLAEHIEGRREMTATQVQAARILLDRVCPPLKPFDIQQVTEQPRDVTTLSPSFLLTLIEQQTKRNT